MKTISKLWQRFKKNIDNIFFIFVLLLFAALAVNVMYSDDTVRGLQELLGLNEKYKKHDVLKIIGYCVAGVVSIWLAWAANKRANAMDATAKNTEAGQRQERLKNAIEHWGHDRDSVRMGGAYELFHLAKDTEDLRQTVLDILCGHIRQTTSEDKYKEKHEEKPSEEIQSLLTLLFAQKHDVFEGYSINLQGSYLNRANLGQTRLKGANLIEAQLQQAQMQGASLSKAQLQGANLSKAQLQGANISSTQLQGADLIKTQLQDAKLMEAQLQGANLFKVRLQRANLSKAQLQGADLSNAQLQGADLFRAQLQGANLMDAQLQGANFWQAQLQGVSSKKEDHLPSSGFESRIKNRIDKPSDLTGIIFADGLQGEPASHELPRGSGADTRTSYTQKEAEQWIAEYNKAMQKAPSADDTANAASAPATDKDKED